MNRPKRTSRNQNWSSLQTGRPIGCPAVFLSPATGSPAPASAVGYESPIGPTPAASAPEKKKIEKKER